MPSETINTFEKIQAKLVVIDDSTGQVHQTATLSDIVWSEDISGIANFQVDPNDPSLITFTPISDGVLQIKADSIIHLP